jgi:hypothetical protein
MDDTLESLDDLENEDGGRGMTMGVILGSAVAAAALAYMLRRRREPEPEPVLAASGAWGRARELAFNDERAQATRDFVIDKLLPELKPALLGILEEVEDLVDQGFRRAERAIKKL